jgi:hypothetical protein
MERVERLQPAFVDEVPETLQPGVLYVSIPYATAVHCCCCGCGEEIVTPLTPTDWRITYDGETVSLSPSVGSWSLRCKSHYVINRGKVRWGGAWTNAQIERQWARDRTAKAAYYGRPFETASEVELALSETNHLRPPRGRSYFKVVVNWLLGPLD